MERHSLDFELTTPELLLELMLEGDVWIERKGDGFFYAVERIHHVPRPINQALAKSLVQSDKLVMQPWTEGWGSASTTKRQRWVHVFSDLA